MGWSIRLFDVGGTAVRIHLTFFLLLAWIAAIHWTRGGAAAAVDGVVFIVLLFAVRPAARVRPRVRGPPLRHRHVGRHAAADRRARLAGAHAGKAEPGNLRGAGGAGGQSRDRAGAGRRARRALRPHADGAAPGGDDHAHGAGCRRQRRAVRVQSHPGLPHGRRARAAGAARHPDGLHARHAGRRDHRPGAGVRVRASSA